MFWKIFLNELINVIKILHDMYHHFYDIQKIKRPS